MDTVTTSWIFWNIWNHLKFTICFVRIWFNPLMIILIYYLQPSLRWRLCLTKWKEIIISRGNKPLNKIFRCNGTLTAEFVSFLDGLGYVTSDHCLGDSEWRVFGTQPKESFAESMREFSLECAPLVHYALTSGRVDEGSRCGDQLSAMFVCFTEYAPPIIVNSRTWKPLHVVASVSSGDVQCDWHLWCMVCSTVLMLLKLLLNAGTDDNWCDLATILMIYVGDWWDVYSLWGDSALMFACGNVNTRAVHSASCCWLLLEKGYTCLFL